MILALLKYDFWIKIQKQTETAKQKKITRTLKNEAIYCEYLSWKSILDPLKSFLSIEIICIMSKIATSSFGKRKINHLQNTITKTSTQKRLAISLKYVW